MHSQEILHFVQNDKIGFCNHLNHQIIKQPNLEEILAAIERTKEKTKELIEKSTFKNE